LAHDLGLTKVPNIRFLVPIARPKEAVTIEQAQSEMDIISRRLAQLEAELSKGWSIQVDDLQNRAVTGFRETLYLLMGAVACILLIACADVANLLLARTASRQKEIAV
jgi:putative ABC transport system permease protein